MRLVGTYKLFQKALIRLQGFLAERIQQLVGSVEHGWLRVDELSLLIAQVSRLIREPRRVDPLVAWTRPTAGELASRLVRVRVALVLASIYKRWHA